MEKFEEIEKKVQQYFLAEEERLTRQGEESRLEYFRKMQEKSGLLWKSKYNYEKSINCDGKLDIPCKTE